MMGKIFVLLSVSCCSLVTAQTLLPETRLVKTYPALKNDIKGRACGEYFIAQPAIDSHGPILVYEMDFKRPPNNPLGKTELGQFLVQIDAAKKLGPTVEILADSSGIEHKTVKLRISRQDYDKSRYENGKNCLPPIRD